MFATVTLYQRDKRAFLATLIVREQSGSDTVTVAKVYEPGTMSKAEFLTSITKDMSKAGVTSYETLDVNVTNWQNFVMPTAN